MERADTSTSYDRTLKCSFADLKKFFRTGRSEIFLRSSPAFLEDWH
jgi:hypothetical protein